MKIAFIGTFPPRQCGIATFTNNLIKSIVVNCDSKDIVSNAYVVAMNDQEEGYSYPEEVRFTINQENQQDYVQAANYINSSEANICILEHEYGIFGGDYGIFILSLIYRLEVPLIVTLHTVLKEPKDEQRLIIQQFGVRAQKIIVMSAKAVRFLTEIYNVPREKIMIIEHGVPDIELPPHDELKNEFNFSNKKILFTFGLLSSNKGLETVIHALPKVVKKHPDVQYMILGNTHPAVVKTSGEEYRNSLMMLAKPYGIKDNLLFNKNFVSERKLFEYLGAIDIYVTPYLNEAQITSGTLSYAVGAGAAVVSTPYWHAQELLADGRGMLFDFEDHDRLADIIIDLLDRPEKLKKMRLKAFNYGLKVRWPKVGKQYLDLADSLIKSKFEVDSLRKPIIDPLMIPPFSMDHINRLTDDTGIVRYAKFGVPILKGGYSLDDNARALMMSIMAFNQNKNREALDKVPVYLSFIQFMQRDNGTFRNLLSFGREYLDKMGSEDSFGRTVWALGYMVRFAHSSSYRKFAKSIFNRALPNFENLLTVRGNANAIMGLYHFIKAPKPNTEHIPLLKKMAENLVNAYNDNCSREWDWFEDSLTYDNGILPLALFASYEITDEKYLLSIAERTTDFLESVTMEDGILHPIGNNRWYLKGRRKSVYAQQSADVLSMVLLFYKAFVVTRARDYLRKMFNCYLWYLGQNMIQTSLYDHETKGCSDGIEKEGINLNQDAESTLAYLISDLTVLQAHSLEFKPEES